MTYLLTFVSYGSHLPGEEGSIDRTHNLPGSRIPTRDAARLKAAPRVMRQQSFAMAETTRHIVLSALHEVCEHGGWRLLAAHIRTKHVHVVVDCDVGPEPRAQWI